MTITAYPEQPKIVPSAGDTVVFTNGADLHPTNAPFQIGAGYTVENVYSSGVKVKGHDQMMFHFEYQLI